MSTRFFTNEGDNTLLKKFAAVFANNPDIERFDALVGYLRASGYFALRPHLQKVPLIRIIVGIDVDDQLAKHHRKGLPAPLDQTLRPFRLVERAEQEMAYWPPTPPGSLVDPVSIPDLGEGYLPQDWSKARKRLWHARMWAICKNEHIRRIEAPVYKRRWDEQWKVSNRWLAGPVAYAQELVDAFRWWLAEKAEWHLEHQAAGGPLLLDTWCAALAEDSRVQAAWPVVADALNQVELWKIETTGKKPAKLPQPDASSTAFAKFFKETVNDETVPDGIPAAVPWEELEKRMKVPKQAKNVRGKLNIPRERFRLRDDVGYIWAGKSK